MVKYGKEFRRNQNLEWRDKYFDYKAKKKMINEYIKKKEGIASNDISFLADLEKWTREFEQSLDKDIKKVYIFFANKERTLFKRLNESLHLKDSYGNFDLATYLNELKKLKELSDLSLKMSYFIFYNLKAVIKCDKDIQFKSKEEIL